MKSSSFINQEWGWTSSSMVVTFFNHGCLANHDSRLIKDGSLSNLRPPPGAPGALKNSWLCVSDGMSTAWLRRTAVQQGTCA